MNFGIVQGRLSNPPNNELQWFPQKNWDKEFEIASKLGFKYIELIAERQHNPNNPIWEIQGIEKIAELNEQNGLLFHSFCNDYIIEHSLVKNTKDVINQSLKLISMGKKLNLEKLIIPLFESSEMNMHNYKDYKYPLKEIGDATKESEMILCLETILDGQQLLDILSYIDHPNIFCVFDTGNRIAYGHDIYADIILLNDHIKHLHIKDKDKNDNNVLLGTGKVNFHKVFKSLAKIDFCGPYTFETNRGKDPIETAKFNLLFAKYFINASARN